MRFFVIPAWTSCEEEMTSSINQSLAPHLKIVSTITKEFIKLSIENSD